jgi:hypothetical protein
MGAERVNKQEIELLPWCIRPDLEFLIHKMQDKNRRSEIKIGLTVVVLLYTVAFAGTLHFLLYGSIAATRY